MNDKVCIALDYSNLSDVKNLVEEIDTSINLYKVGLELYLSCGKDVINYLKEKDKDIFLDLKLHDIPNTVGRACSVISRDGIRFFTVHLSGGTEMLKAARQSVDKVRTELNTISPDVVGVSILTSIDENILHNEIGIKIPLQEAVMRFAELAIENSIDWIVCSPEEVELVKSRFGSKIKVITPGIRVKSSPKDDQRRTMTPKEAIDKGSDILVIGRSVTNSIQPKKTVDEILESIV